MKYLFLSILALQTSFACELEFSPRLLVVDEAGSGKKILIAKNCDERTVNTAIRTLETIDGRISSEQLSEILKQNGPQEISISPKIIRVQQLKSLIRDQIHLPNGVQISSVHIKNSDSILEVHPNEQIEVSCHGCLFGNSQPVVVGLQNIDGARRIFNATVDFKKLVKAYRLLSPVPAFGDLSAVSNFKEEYVESIPHIDLITDLGHLKFYKTNKLLRAGDLLKESDLAPLDLVRAGAKVDVVLENEMVRIKTQAVSHTNGTFGEFVEIFHPQKNKKYQGKVIDINKVLVEL